VSSLICTLISKKNLKNLETFFYKKTVNLGFSQPCGCGSAPNPACGLEALAPPDFLAGFHGLTEENGGRKVKKERKK